MRPPSFEAIAALLGAITAFITAIIALVKALRNESDIRDTDQRARNHVEVCHPPTNGKPSPQPPEGKDVAHG